MPTVHNADKLVLVDVFAHLTAKTSNADGQYADKKKLGKKFLGTI